MSPIRAAYDMHGSLLTMEKMHSAYGCLHEKELYNNGCSGIQSIILFSAKSLASGFPGLS